MTTEKDKELKDFIGKLDEAMGVLADEGGITCTECYGSGDDAEDSSRACFECKGSGKIKAKPKQPVKPVAGIEDVFKEFLVDYLKNVAKKLPESYRAKQLAAGGLEAAMVIEFETLFLHEPFMNAIKKIKPEHHD
jgi:hypothetical protein